MSNYNEVRIFVRKELQSERVTNPFLDSLITKFKEYKSGVLDPHFGKDVPYHKPAPYTERARLRHVHILQRVQTIRIRHSNTSDSVLVYTEASMTPNTYYIIDYLADKAHEKARDLEYMDWLIEKAEAFRTRK